MGYHSLFAINDECNLLKNHVNCVEQCNSIRRKECIKIKLLEQNVLVHVSPVAISQITNAAESCPRL